MYITKRLNTFPSYNLKADNMRKIGLLMFFILFLMLFSFRGYAEPIWSNPTNITPATYNQLTNSLFNITC